MRLSRIFPIILPSWRVVIPFLFVFLGVMVLAYIFSRGNVIPIGALIVAGAAFGVVVYQINISIRPWLSVSDPAGTILHSEEHKTPVAVYKMPIFNTGSIPAKDIRIETTFQGLKPELTESPALAPNNCHTVAFSIELKGNWQRRTRIGDVQVKIEYSSLNRRHETLQTYSVKPNQNVEFRPSEGSLYLVPIKPTHFT